MPAINLFISKYAKLVIVSFFLIAFSLIIFMVKTVETNLELSKQYSKGYYLSQQNKHQQAFKIMQNLAIKNYPPAVQNLALSYKNGLGVDKNQILANQYFEKAHNLGILDATNELANIYYSRKNIIKALKYWQIASNSGDEYATYNLAMHYFQLNKNIKAKKLLLQSLQMGYPNSLKIQQLLNN